MTWGSSEHQDRNVTAQPAFVTPSQGKGSYILALASSSVRYVSLRAAIEEQSIRTSSLSLVFCSVGCLFRLLLANASGLLGFRGGLLC